MHWFAGVLSERMWEDIRSVGLTLREESLERALGRGVEAGRAKTEAEAVRMVEADVEEWISER
jgi:hypothetical protein